MNLGEAKSTQLYVSSEVKFYNVEELKELLGWSRDTVLKLFNDPKLFVKVYAVLSRHKFKQPVRRRIMQYFDNCISSPEIIENAVKIMNGLDNDLLLAHELEE